MATNTMACESERHIALFADVDANLIDGSTVWLHSIAIALSALPNVFLHIFLRDRISRATILEPLRSLENVNVIEPARAEKGDAYPPLDPSTFVTRLHELSRKTRISGVLVRGNRFGIALARDDVFAGRLWAYLLDKPPLVGDITTLDYVEIARRARFLIAQTEGQRALLEARIPEANGKTIVLPPMVPSLPTGTKAAPRSRPSSTDLRLIYAGKYSKLWNVERYFEIPTAASRKNISAKVIFAGDKIHIEKSDPQFHERIRMKLNTTEGVVWRGALSRRETMKTAAGCDFGLCWRREELNDSIEISTKFLEFSALGIPSFINKSESYVLAVGADYPYFANEIEDITSALARIEKNPDEYELASRRCFDFAQAFSIEAATARLKRLLDLTPHSRPEPKTVVIASHEFKFITQVRRHFEQDPAIRTVIDTWSSQREHREKHSLNALSAADVIFCEWCSGAAVWYSKNKRPNQRLVIRLHRFEYFTEFPSQVNIENVDAIIVVSLYFKRLLEENLGWPGEKIIVEPQYVDAEYLNREKHQGAEKTLGFVGIVSFSHKRLDRAVEVLERVLEKDGDFRLRIRSRMPWEFPWAWEGDPAGRMGFQRVFEKIHLDAKLRDAIIFDPAGADMGEWYRNIGFMLSTSESEGCHTSIAEGMASGAIPMLINWDGAKSVYPKRYVHDTVSEMANHILSISSDQVFQKQAANEAIEFGRANFDVTRTLALFGGLLDN